MFQRARVAQARHPDLGEVSGYCFYATRLRFGDLAFDIGANVGQNTLHMVKRGARVVAVEPQADLAANLAKRFPTATVSQVAVSDEPGTTNLHLAVEGSVWASLNAEWNPIGEPPTWYDAQPVNVITLRDLINRHGQPRLIKIDTESFDHRVLRTLDRPVDHILFEVAGAYPQHASEALRHLDSLGVYEYRLGEFSSWQFGPPQNSEEILLDVTEWGSATWGNVYARVLDHG